MAAANRKDSFIANPVAFDRHFWALGSRRAMPRHGSFDVKRNFLPKLSVRDGRSGFTDQVQDQLFPWVTSKTRRLRHRRSLPDHRRLGALQFAVGETVQQRCSLHFCLLNFFITLVSSPLSRPTTDEMRVSLADL